VIRITAGSVAAKVIYDHAIGDAAFAVLVGETMDEVLDSIYLGDSISVFILGSKPFKTVVLKQLCPVQKTNGTILMVFQVALATLGRNFSLDPTTCAEI
jgi:hypothetical protein